MRQFALIRPHMVAMTLCCPKLPIYTLNCLSPLGRKCKFFSLSLHCSKIRIERLEKFVGSSKNVSRPFLYQKGVARSAPPRIIYVGLLRNFRRVWRFFIFHTLVTIFSRFTTVLPCVITAASLSSKFKIDISCAKILCGKNSCHNYKKRIRLLKSN